MKPKMPLAKMRRTREILLLLAITLFLLAAPSAQYADNLNNSGNFFWDNLSWDGGGNTNIGFCMTSTGNCAGMIPDAPGVAPYWALPGGGADPDFTLSSSQPITFTFEFALAGIPSANTFGWILPNDPGSGAAIFTGSNAQGDTVTLPPGTYAFYLNNIAPGVGETWYSQASLNLSGEQTDQHFVVFDAGSSYWIGMENLPFCCSDLDYQDMLVQVATGGGGGTFGIQGSQGGTFHSWELTPEPATFSLLLVGLVGVGLTRRKSVF